MVGAVVVVLVLLAGLNALLTRADTYTADLTKGHGDFPAGTYRGFSTSYQADGYHVTISDAGWAPIGLSSSTVHAALTVAVDVTVLTATADSAIPSMFGPWCWDEPGQGYGLEVGGNGLVYLEQATEGRIDILSVGHGSWPTGTSLRLMLRCAAPGSGWKPLVAGYVNGQQVAEAAPTAPISVFQRTGFAGFVARGGTPMEWKVTRFWRLPYDTSPK